MDIKSKKFSNYLGVQRQNLELTKPYTNPPKWAIMHANY